MTHGLVQKAILKYVYLSLLVVLLIHSLPLFKKCNCNTQEHLWSLDKTEIRVPPTLIIQIWDNDKFSPDDFLGEFNFLLCHLHFSVLRYFVGFFFCCFVLQKLAFYVHWKVDVAFVIFFFHILCTSAAFSGCVIAWPHIDLQTVVVFKFIHCVPEVNCYE